MANGNGNGNGNGEGDECVWCSDGYWDCGEPPHCQDEVETVDKKEGPWTKVGQADITAGRYNIYCHRGKCRVLLVPVGS